MQEMKAIVEKYQSQTAELKATAAGTTSPLIVKGNNTHGQCTIIPSSFVGDYFVIYPFVGVSMVAPTGWLPQGRRVVQVALGYEFTLLLTFDSLLYAVGDNCEGGQLGRGHGGLVGSEQPQRVMGIDSNEHIVQIAAGHSNAGAVTESGTLFMWGCNYHGHCGHGHKNEVHVATCCKAGAFADAHIVFVACGSYHSVALTRGGDTIVFGYNADGQLGTGGVDAQLVPTMLACAALDGVRIASCAAGGNFTHLVSDDGRVFAMGNNDYGQLGTGSDSHGINNPTPTVIDAEHFGSSPVVALVCGEVHMLALTRNGKVYAAGCGGNGTLGLGHTENALTPQPLVGAVAGARIVRIGSSRDVSYALTEQGQTFEFGTSMPALPSPRDPQFAAMVAAGAVVQPIPQLVPQEGATVCTLGSGCFAKHSINVVGTPPAAPGSGSAARIMASMAWLRRRTLLLCLLRAFDNSEDGPPIVAASDGVLLRMTALPEELWKGSRIFQFL